MSNRRQPDSLISESRFLLQNPYAFLNADGRYDALPEKALLGNPYAFDDGAENNAHAFAFSESFVESLSRLTPEAAAKSVLRELWRSRKAICGTTSVDPKIFANPYVVAEALGVRLESADQLGLVDTPSGQKEVAAYFDRPNRRIRLSTRVKRVTWRFTAAHEIGHWVLHPKEISLHRDLPLENARRDGDLKERQADRFAACFLMPEKLVISAFESRFGPNVPFRLDTDAAFGLARDRYSELLGFNLSGRQLAQYLATAEQFHTERFDCLANEFGVSATAMAYRLLELKLI